MIDFDLTYEEYADFARPVVEQYHASDVEELLVGMELWQTLDDVPPEESGVRTYTASEEAVLLLADLLEHNCFAVKLKLPAQIKVMRLVNALRPPP